MAGTTILSGYRLSRESLGARSHARSEAPTDISPQSQPSGWSSPCGSPWDYRTHLSNNGPGTWKNNNKLYYSQAWRISLHRPAGRGHRETEIVQAGLGCCSDSGREGWTCVGSGVPLYWWTSNLKAGNKAQAAEDKLQNGQLAKFETAKPKETSGLRRPGRLSPPCGWQGFFWIVFSEKLNVRHSQLKIPCQVLTFYLDWQEVPKVTEKGLLPFPEFAQKITSDGNPVQSQNQESGIGGKWVSSSVPSAPCVRLYHHQFSQDTELFNHHKELLHNPLQSHSLLP